MPYCRWLLIKPIPINCLDPFAPFRLACRQRLEVPMPVIPLKPLDRVEVLSVMDNSIDVLMGNTPVASRIKR